VTSSANIFGIVVGDEVEDFPWEKRPSLLPALDGEQELVTRKRLNHSPSDSDHDSIKFEDSTGKRAHLIEIGKDTVGRLGT